MFYIFVLLMAFTFANWQPPTPDQSRSPCPALNTLANHGYINRNGLDIKQKDLVNAMSLVYNLSPFVGNLLVKAALGKLKNENGNLDLYRLGLHGFIEHDASLVHLDTNLGNNSIPSPELIEQFASINNEQPLTLEEVGKFRALRARDTLQNNPNPNWGLKEKVTAYAEASLLYLVLNRDGKLQPEHLRSFLGEERLPQDFRPSEKEIGLAKIGWVAFQVQRKTSHYLNQFEN